MDLFHPIVASLRHYKIGEEQIVFEIDIYTETRERACLLQVVISHHNKQINI